MTFHVAVGDAISSWWQRSYRPFDYTWCRIDAVTFTLSTYLH